MNRDKDMMWFLLFLVSMAGLMVTGNPWCLAIMAVGALAHIADAIIEIVREVIKE